MGDLAGTAVLVDVSWPMAFLEQRFWSRVLPMIPILSGSIEGLDSYMPLNEDKLEFLQLLTRILSGLMVGTEERGRRPLYFIVI
jgi:hypothetical protein